MIGTDLPPPSSKWWGYFCLALVLTVLSLLRGPSSPFDVVWSIFSTFALVGLWGYIRQVAVGWQLFWIGYFVLSMSLILVGLIADLAEYGIPSPMELTVLSVMALLVAPLYLALWRYAFRSHGVWQDENA